jgi:hypothetical protein
MRQSGQSVAMTNRIEPSSWARTYGYLELRWRPVDEYYGRLHVEALSGSGFGGRSGGWFTPEQVEQFARRLGEYPLDERQPPPELVGGVGGEPFVIEAALKVYPVGLKGQLGLGVVLGTDWSRSGEPERAEAFESVRLEILTTYERVGNLGRDVLALVKGRTDFARIEGEELT